MVQAHWRSRPSIVKHREKVKRPEGIEIFYFKNEMEIETVQPIPSGQIVNLSLSPFILLFSLLLYFLKDSSNAIYVASAAAVATAFGLYSVLRRRNKKIYINCNDEEVTIQRRPQNLIKDQKYSRDEVEQVYVKQGTDGMSLYFVINGSEGQKNVPVLTRIRDVSQAKYMEQEIEKYLGLKDRVVYGEL